MIKKIDSIIYNTDLTQENPSLVPKWPIEDGEVMESIEVEVSAKMKKEDNRFDAYSKSGNLSTFGSVIYVVDSISVKFKDADITELLTDKAIERLVSEVEKEHWFL